MTEIEQQIISNTRDFVKERLKGAEGGHDWFHVERVYNRARTIASREKGNQFIIEIGALLHDIADAKFHQGDETIGPRIARSFLETQQMSAGDITHVENIIIWISFKGGNERQDFFSRELDIVQDADRLDAMGAIGIARTFNYGGFKGRLLYDPAIPPVPDMDKETYRTSEGPTINHFYEKLLLLKDRMNTSTGKRMAEERHRFMELFLRQFYREWSGES